jgi:hypothetical protein
MQGLAGHNTTVSLMVDKNGDQHQLCRFLFGVVGDIKDIMIRQELGRSLVRLSWADEESPWN